MTPIWLCLKLAVRADIVPFSYGSLIPDVHKLEFAKGQLSEFVKLTFRALAIGQTKKNQNEKSA